MFKSDLIAKLGNQSLEVDFSTPVFSFGNKKSSEYLHQQHEINQMINCYNSLKSPDLVDEIYKTALIESCLIHIRSLLEFFNPKLSTLKKAKSDLKAIKIIHNWEDEYNDILMNNNIDTFQLNMKMDILTQSAIHLSGNRANFIKSDNSIIFHELFLICCKFALSFNSLMNKEFLDSALEIEIRTIIIAD